MSEPNEDKEDEYGNTEAEPFRYCTFPDCGCDGARVCQATEGPSDRACSGNVEGMWSGGTLKQRKAGMKLMAECCAEGEGAEE